jgi:tetratricopeptide (TPR) repeat protein
MKPRPAAALATILVLLPALGHAQDPGAAILRARELLRAGDTAQATTVLEGARTQAATAGAKNEEASALFYLGMAQQARIENAALPESDRRDARNEAIAAYEQSLQAAPASGPALNNLAQLYRADPNRRDEADTLLAKAIDLDDSRKGVYLLNRATLKRDAGDIPGALGLAEQAASEDRASLRAHSTVVEIALASPNAAPLLTYVRELNASGLVARALDTTASALQSRAADRTRLLLSIGESLGSPAYADRPSRFAETDAGKTVQSFRDDPTIGAGVRELFSVLEQPAQSLVWWQRGRGEPNSPATTMQNLLRRCAEIYRSAGAATDLGLAEGYYRLAIDQYVDARSLIGLGEILLNGGRLDELTQLVQRYEQPLLIEKGAALVRHDDREVYELRVALGMIYGYTKRWVNRQTPFAAAIWMLENAQESAASFNREHSAAEQIRLPPEAVKMLSTGYAQTGNLAASVTVRLDAADRYLAANEPRRAQDVLDAAWRGSLPATLDATVVRRLERTLDAARNAQ